MHLIPFELFFIGLILSITLTPIVIRIAKHFSIFSMSLDADNNKQREVPLLGGVAIFTSFLMGFIFILPYVQDSSTLVKHSIGFLLGGFFLIIGGTLDDKYSLSPRQQIIWPLLAIATVIISGIGITYFTNPFSPEKLIYVNTLQYDLLQFKGIPYRITLPADIITFIWLAVIMYSTKLQDGLDGLVSGISFIGAIFVFLLSYFVFDDILLSALATLFAGVLLGFLKFNIYPAKIFLGESGSLLTGFILGVLALLSDAKIILTLLLLAVPISDAVWTVTRRLYKRQYFWKGDQNHLHHRLIKAGYSKKSAVFLLYFITFGFGVLVLLWQSSFQYYFYGVSFVIVLIIFSLFYFSYGIRSNK